jgi:hypothetical protein
MYALFTLRVTRMHLRRAFPDLRPVVVITPNPDGGRGKKNGNINPLRMRPSLAERMRRLCRGCCVAALSRSLASCAP